MPASGEERTYGESPANVASESFYGGEESCSGDALQEAF
jgi:hypothetical protein